MGDINKVVAIQESLRRKKSVEEKSHNKQYFGNECSVMLTFFFFSFFICTICPSLDSPSK